ncbi:pilus assembly protein PilP [Janthinobacterium psychrotolerans]|uniref:Type IV pilus assembly protein PilO n=1 Tax=Janthinobacterium psychrotolerans TaxID=1747903 RepID=A0A1A7BU92_9BURK|nr:pilus assembly protein PilP [Janthinobacterium psychrotolerans]OBV37126.1 type IV pilus assembly protein PilO [Janthinobacterium psychrotolerans]
MSSLKQMALWPRGTRLACAGLLAGLTLALAWLAQLDSLVASWQAAQAHTGSLRAAHGQAQAQAGQLPQLRARQQEAAATLAALERQLPRQQEMPALLSAINQAGLARGLQFELFKPAAPLPQAHYVAMPIAIRVRGGYHALGAFMADLAYLPRIVTVHGLAVQANQEGALTLDAVLRAYRLPDAQEQKRMSGMKASRTTVPPRPPKPLVPRDYSASDLPDPFGAAASVRPAAAGVAAPDPRRVREPLESVALSAMAMVGSLRQHGRLDALLQANGRLYRVAAGQYLGQDHGVVTAISEQAITYREVAQDAGGAWRERRGSLALQVAGAAGKEADK